MSKTVRTLLKLIISLLRSENNTFPNPRPNRLVIFHFFFLQLYILFRLQVCPQPLRTCFAACPDVCRCSAPRQSTKWPSAKSSAGCRHRNVSTPPCWAACSEGKRRRQLLFPFLKISAVIVVRVRLDRFRHDFAAPHCGKNVTINRPKSRRCDDYRVCSVDANEKWNRGNTYISRVVIKVHTAYTLL